MPLESEPRWERALTRELKSLPELSAPPALMARVLERIRRIEVRPWYRAPWQEWNVPLRVASLALLVALFGGVTFAAWQFYHGPVAAALLSQLDTSLDQANALLNAVLALAGAAVVVVQSMGTAWLIALGTIALFSYLLCIGAGTAAVRLFAARRRSYFP